MSELSIWSIAAGLFAIGMLLAPELTRRQIEIALRRSAERGDPETLRLIEARRVGLFYARIYPYGVIGAMTLVLFGLQAFRMG